MRVAIRRAAHQLLDVPPVLLDPMAIPILDGETRAALRADPGQFEKGRLSSYLRAFFAVRSRFAEDQLAAARVDGVRQYVILGAGLDTFACSRSASPWPKTSHRRPSTPDTSPAGVTVSKWAAWAI